MDGTERQDILQGWMYMLSKRLGARQAPALLCSALLVLQGFPKCIQREHKIRWMDGMYSVSTCIVN